MKLERWTARENLGAQTHVSSPVNANVRRILSLLGRIVLIGILAYGAFLGYTAWRTMLRLKQVRNCADLQVMTAAIQSFHEKTGRYPSSIREAVNATGMSETNKSYYAAQQDAWGGRFLYSVGESGFTLRSFGRDRQADPPQENRSCADLSADVFSNESGIVRCCGK